jgi:hypothetical protein
MYCFVAALGMTTNPTPDLKDLLRLIDGMNKAIG